MVNNVADHHGGDLTDSDSDTDIKVGAGLYDAELWELVQAEVEAIGLHLYDLDIPKSEHGIFRVYIAKEQTGKVAVALEDCIKVGKKLQREDLEPQLPGGTVEVSSPGVNRRLRRSPHFEGAVGERVKVTVLAGTQPSQGSPYVGLLKKFDGASLYIEAEGDGAEIVVAQANIKDARVEFLF